MKSQNSVFRFKRGDHTCVFYHKPDDLLGILEPYILEGLRQGEKCFCAQTAAMAKHLEAGLERAGVDVAREKKRGALQIISEKETYFPQGRFDCARLVQLLERSIELAVKDGFSGFRTAGELRWAASGMCDCDQLVEYEQMVEALFPERGAVGICQYPLDAFAPENLQRVLEAHRIAVSQTMGQAKHSSYYVRRGKFAADIVADRHNPASRYYYVVQPHGTADIIGWGFEDSFEAAMSSSECTIADMERHGRVPLS